MFNYKKTSEEQCEFVPVAVLSELSQGERLFVQVDDLPIVLFNIGGNLFAIGDVCSHDDGPLGDGDLGQFEVTCPRHGAVFDIRSGKALSLPAIVDIPAYPVRVEDEQILIGIPKE